MITVLTNLEEAIEIYGSPHLNQQEDKQIEQALLSELAKIENDSHDRYFSHGNLKMAQESFRKFYTKLRNLFNLLYQKKGGQPDAAILKFHKLVKTFEELYNRDMILNDPLTDYQYQLLKADVLEKFPALKDVLHKKGIPQYLLSEIQSVLDSHFNNNDSKLYYHHYLFYNKLLQALAKIANDTRTKELDRRFIESMININFNSMSFLERCCEQLDSMLLDLTDIEKQVKYLTRTLFRLGQTTQDPNLHLHYNPDVRLIDSLIKYVEQKQHEITESLILDHDNQDDTIGIPSNLSAGGVIVFYHYIQKENFIKSENKKAGAQNFASNVILSNGTKLTMAQLLKFDKGKLYNEIRSFAIKLKAILAVIEIDLDNSYKSPKNKR